MRTVVLNRPALWRPIRSNETSIRKYSGAYPYTTESGLVAQSSLRNPVTRYAKNFTKYKKDFSLFIFTDETDTSKVENFFEKLVKNLTQAEIAETLETATLSNFKYLDTIYRGKK